jgi:hypothetical protein
VRRYTGKTCATEHREREKESAGGGVIKLTTIVTLDGLDGKAELCEHPSEEVKERGEKYQTSHAMEKSTNNEKNHQPPQGSTYSQKY